MIEYRELLTTDRFKKEISNLDQVGISPKAYRLMRQLLNENPRLEDILRRSDHVEQVRHGIRHWALQYMEKNPSAFRYYKQEVQGPMHYNKLTWKDFAAIRLLDYLDHAGERYTDLNLRGYKVLNAPFKLLFLAYKNGTGGASPSFFEDMIELFAQFTGQKARMRFSSEEVMAWMERYPSGLQPEVVDIRSRNRERILNIIIDKLDKGLITRPRFSFDAGLSRQEKYRQALEWWNDWHFHLHFAVRSADLLNEMLDRTVDTFTMKMLYRAEKKGIPIFVNPYYLSLLNVKAPAFVMGADLALRSYVFYSRHLIKEFGSIVAWEKEDIVEPGKPNAAGWLLPNSYNIHRRYPDVAILIPDTAGRACGGLCASCQRMYDFQRGHLNFDLNKLRPKGSWPVKLRNLLSYFENDSQLRDILITGGDALMSRDQSLKIILDAIYDMALRKRQANEKRENGNKYAEMVRVRLGTRLPVYLPQRITPALIRILKEFREKAYGAGIKQFIIQTHFESPMEVTPEAREAVGRLLSAGWMVTNQLVFTSSASRRGHTAQLRKVLNDIGILPYHTFTVKGYMENYSNFANNARVMQEQEEEKILGKIMPHHYNTFSDFPLDTDDMVSRLEAMRETHHVPFLASDRNVLNLPGVGKSLTFRVIGITRDGRRILQFDHDRLRKHSPIIHKMGKVIIIESKSLSDYLAQLDEMGEDLSEYSNIYGYSIGETRPQTPVFDYPTYDFDVTRRITNLDVKSNFTLLEKLLEENAFM